MDSSQWSSRSLHGPRVDHIGHLRTTTLRPYRGGIGVELTQIDQQLEAQADMFAFCEMCPPRSLNVAGGKAILEIATVDMPEDCLPRRQLDLRFGTVNSPGMTLEVVAKRQSTEECVLGNGATLVAVGDVVDQRERRDQLPVFRKVPLQCRRHLARSQAPFEISAPTKEVIICRLVEAEAGHCLKRSPRCPQRERGRQVELASTLEDLPRPLPCRSVLVFINVAPFRHRIGPDHQTESLNQPITAGSAPVSAADVFADARRLGIAENR